MYVLFSLVACDILGRITDARPDDALDAEDMCSAKIVLLWAIQELRFWLVGRWLRLRKTYYSTTGWVEEEAVGAILKDDLLIQLLCSLSLDYSSDLSQSDGFVGGRVELCS